MKFKIILLSITILAAILRLWNLSNFPAGFNADEASIGYNAYSLLHSGKDEYGTFFPLSFKSFGDYKPGLYFYFVMPFVAVLGLSEWAVRLPSAFFGIGTIVLIYFLSKEIFKNRWVGILSAAMLAISPWHLHFSRGGWETNVATFFITLGVWLFIKGLNDFRFLIFSMISFLASMYIYQSPRLVIPILLVCLAILYRKNLISTVRTIRLKITIFMIIGLMILTLPIALQFTSQTGTARFSGLSFLGDSGPASRVDQLRGEHKSQNGLLVKLIHNKLMAYGPNFLGHYLDHFSGNFLFINGDPIIRNKVPETGQFYLIEALFLILGLISLIKVKFEHTKLLLAWILIAPAASSLTYQTPHALRSLNMVIPLTLVISWGLWIFVSWLKKFGRVKSLIILGIITAIFSFEFIRYLESYYVHYPKRYPLAWEYGFKEMVGKLGIYERNFNSVVITDRYDQPYILVLFYKKYEPVKYQQQAVLSPRDKFNFGTVRSFDNYQFRSIDPKEIANSAGTLFVATEEETPKDAKILDRVYFPNGQIAFEFVKGGK